MVYIYNYKQHGFRDWSQLSVDGTTLPQALKCWEDGGSEQNHYDKSSQLSYFEMADRFITGYIHLHTYTVKKIGIVGDSVLFAPQVKLSSSTINNLQSKIHAQFVAHSNYYRILQ